MEPDTQEEALEQQVAELRAELASCAAERERLEARLATLSTALADTAHSLKSPLTVILSYSELLLEDCDELSEEAVQDLQTIAHATRALASMITEKLTPAAE